MIVADANTIAYLMMEGIFTPLARQAYDRDPVWLAPPLWRAEFLSVLVTSTRTGVIHERQARAVWLRALQTVTTRDEPGGPTVLHVALRNRISAHDAQYVVLAKMLKTIVVTGDRELAERCPDVAVLLEDFTAGG